MAQQGPRGGVFARGSVLLWDLEERFPFAKLGDAQATSPIFEAKSDILIS